MFSKVSNIFKKSKMANLGGGSYILANGDLLTDLTCLQLKDQHFVPCDELNWCKAATTPAVSSDVSRGGGGIPLWQGCIPLDRRLKETKIWEGRLLLIRYRHK